MKTSHRFLQRSILSSQRIGIATASAICAAVGIASAQTLPPSPWDGSISLDGTSGETFFSEDREISSGGVEISLDFLVEYLVVGGGGGGGARGGGGGGAGGMLSNVGGAGLAAC